MLVAVTGFHYLAVLGAMALAVPLAHGQGAAAAFEQNRIFAEQSRNLEAQRAASAADQARALDRSAWKSSPSATAPGSFLSSRSTSRASSGQPAVTFAPVYDPFTDPMNVAKRILGDAESSSSPQAPSTVQRDAQILEAYFGQSKSRDARAAVAAAVPLAQKGNAAAALVLAVAYLSGDGVVRDDNRAFEWMSRAAKAGMQPAQVLLGEMYLAGLGAARSRDSALAQFEQAAQSGYAPGHLRAAQTLLDSPASGPRNFAAALLHAEAARHELPRAGFEVGLILLDDRPGVPRDLWRALPALYQAASAGHPTAQYLYALCLDAGIGSAREPGKAQQWYEKAAAQGVPMAQARAGEAYAFGLAGIARDRDRALTLLEAAAQHGEDSAYNTIGVLLSNSGVPGADLRRAVEFFRKGAELGDPPAEFNLGVAYMEGVQVKADQRQAIAWLEKSAQAGHAPAQEYLGMQYQLGEAVPKNLATAEKLFEQAAGQGYALAMDSLCDMAFMNETSFRLDAAGEASWLLSGLRRKQPACLYVVGVRAFKGIGAFTGPDLAVSLLQESANLGYHYAESDLGQLYLLGRYVPSDPDLAIKWLTRAANHGNRRARDLLQQSGVR